MVRSRERRNHAYLWGEQSILKELFLDKRGSQDEARGAADARQTERGGFQVRTAA